MENEQHSGQEEQTQPRKIDPTRLDIPETLPILPLRETTRVAGEVRRRLGLDRSCATGVSSR